MVNLRKTHDTDNSPIAIFMIIQNFRYLRVGENLTAPHYQKKGDLFEKLNLTGIPHY
jgi:hypothetical protein